MLEYDYYLEISNEGKGNKVVLELPTSNDLYAEAMDSYFESEGKTCPTYGLFLKGITDKAERCYDIDSANRASSLLSLADSMGCLNIVLAVVHYTPKMGASNIFGMVQLLERILKDTLEDDDTTLERIKESSRLHYTPKSLRPLAEKLPASWHERSNSYTFEGLEGRFKALIAPREDGYVVFSRYMKFHDNPSIAYRGEFYKECFSNVDEAIAYVHKMHLSYISLEEATPTSDCISLEEDTPLLRLLF